MKPNDIAHGRSGDKGDKANVGIRVEDPKDYPFLTEYLTEALMAELFEGLLNDPGVESIDRYELPELGAVNFVLHDALGGGAGQSLRTDPQGKAFAGLVLRQDISEAYESFERNE